MGGQIVPDLRRLLTIASKHRAALAIGAAGFFLAAPCSVIASLWLKTGMVPNRLEPLQPALRSSGAGLSLVTVRAVAITGGWEYEFTIREAARLLAPSLLFGLYVCILTAIIRSGKTRRVFLMRGAVKSRPGVLGGLLALTGNAAAAGISLTPPCIGVVTTVSLLGLAGFGAAVVILPYVYVAGLVLMLLSLTLLVRRAGPDVTQEGRAPGSAYGVPADRTQTNVRPADASRTRPRR
jgi:hypothetical protein